jgi:uncharacterized protein (TIGR00730 family)
MRSRTGDPELDRRIADFLNSTGATADKDQLFEILTTVTRLAGDHASRLDLKITNAALKEMRDAFNVFARYRDVPKVTMFGSARTLPDDPLYGQARDLAHALARSGWMVVTGAGPGIMAAGMEGAGREMSLGVNIRLPFEQDASQFIAGDEKLVEMKYFFTRKLMLIKESAGFVVLPGGFGTLDEAFELLTLEQTGKADPVPIVLLEVPGGSYWRAWQRFIDEELMKRGLVSPEDEHLYCITDDVMTAARELIGFYRNYHSRRFVGDLMVIRLEAPPTDDELAMLNREFADIVTTGTIERVDPLPAERSTRDHLDLPRIALHFDRLSHGRLRQAIDALNSLPSAPPLHL